MEPGGEESIATQSDDGVIHPDLDAEENELGEVEPNANHSDETMLRAPDSKVQEPAQWQVERGEPNANNSYETVPNCSFETMLRAPDSQVEEPAQSQVKRAEPNANNPYETMPPYSFETMPQHSYENMTESTYETMGRVRESRAQQPRPVKKGVDPNDKSQAIPVAHFQTIAIIDVHKLEQAMAALAKERQYPLRIDYTNRSTRNLYLTLFITVGNKAMFFGNTVDEHDAVGIASLLKDEDWRSTRRIRYIMDLPQRPGPSIPGEVVRRLRLNVTVYAQRRRVEYVRETFHASQICDERFKTPDS
ncbi:uncharacterized protein RCC_01878 [Ramularia collo-cygni]|uniref:Uncharacterized protein n=1 Tax=Ramularia collo-cygni TaxID=112498 RepID=A0A2D3UPT3_9PEZI|nr:uncharacterized protein RCC_01878 [Ramularia collo-cygni]CZT16038.1 uncharacterized protein RCC_01878 [Ramularia collo-cygni]